MSIATTLFFMWGFLTPLNDILIPHLKAIFDLNYAKVMLVQFAFFSSYFVFAWPAGKIVEWGGLQAHDDHRPAHDDRRGATLPPRLTGCPRLRSFSEP
jgi:hypothetical protein